MLRLLDVLSLNCSFTRNLPAGAPLLPATYRPTVHSRGFAGRSSASFSNRKCCMSDLSSSPKLACKLRTVREDLDLPRKLHILFVPSVAIRSPVITAHNISMSGCSREISWLFNVRHSRRILVETNTSLRSVVGGTSSIVCQHITLDGSIRRTFQPRAGGKFCFEIWWKCTSKRAQRFLFVILMGI